MVGNYKNTERGERKAEYAEIKGVVTKKNNTRISINSSYEVRVSAESLPAQFKYATNLTYYLSQDKTYHKGNMPNVGDEVILRSRKTKERPCFNPFHAQISGVVKNS